MRESSEHSRAVARIGFAATSASMVHAQQHAVRILHDLVAAFALDVGDEADAAGLVFVGGIVKSNLSGSEGSGHGGLS